ncbi:transportin-3 [Marchantia polymorpha subsp. ruderalis]
MPAECSVPCIELVCAPVDSVMDLQTQVAQAVQVLNHDLQSCNRVAANQWLVHFQHTDAAWEVATKILALDSIHTHDYEVELFASQVLKRKIQSDAGSLKPEDRSALQNALLMSAKKFSTGPSQLLRQICLALSALVLRAVEWRKPVEQLFASLSELQGQGTGSNAILELLTVLPEEVMEDQLVNCSVDPNRRWQFTRELLSHTGAVLEFLLQHTKNDSMENSQLHDKQRKVLRCLLSWVSVGCFLEVPQSSIPTHPLLNFVYNSLQDASTFDLAVEVLTELVSRHETLPQVLLPRMLSVKEALLMPALATGNENIVNGLVSLMAELGQAAPALIAQASTDALALADALLRCVAFPCPDWEIAESTLQFWCTLAEYLLAMGETHGELQKQRALATFIPVYSALLDALVMRSQVGSGEYVEDDLDGNTGLPDGLAHFRVSLDEPLADICRLLGPSQYFAKLLHGADTWCSFDSIVPWQVVEARLFALNMVSDVVLQGGQLLDLTPVMHLLVYMQSGNCAIDPILMNLIHKSGAQVVGSYSGWICSYPNAILPLLSFLAAGLPIPVAASACATALRKMCEDVSSIATEPTTFEGLIRVGEELYNVHLSLQEEEDVVCAIGCVLSTLTSSAELNKALERLLKPSHEAITALLKTDSEGSLKLHSASYAAALEAGIRALHRLGIYFSQLSSSSVDNFNGEEPMLRILAHFWPLLERLLLSRHTEDGGLALAACKTLSHAIQASGRKFSTLLPNIMTALSSNFIAYQSHVCFIRTAAVAVEEFGHESDHGSLFIETLRVFTASDAMSQMNSSYACDQEPELAEAYMNFTSSFVRCCPREVVAASDELLEASFDKAAICCTAMHRGAAIAAMSYMSCFLGAGLSSLMDPGSDKSKLSLATVTAKICYQSGENVISGILYALLGVSAMARVHKATTILQQLAAFCYIGGGDEKLALNWSSLQSWLVAAVQALPPEYLKQGEIETLIATWLSALEAAASDYYKSRGACNGGRTGAAGYMQGDGGRTLKRVLREFADAHRYTTPGFGTT